MTTNPETRLDRLEALAETTLLAIRELSNRQERTQQQLELFQGESRQQMAELRQQFTDVAHQQAINAEQIAEMRSGIVELRNVVADMLRTRG